MQKVVETDQIHPHRTRHNTPRHRKRRPHDCTYGPESSKLEGWKSKKNRPKRLIEKLHAL